MSLTEEANPTLGYPAEEFDLEAESAVEALSLPFVEPSSDLSLASEF